MASAVCILDTSIFCESLAISGKSSRHEEISAELREKILERYEAILLPMATIFETGTHIAQQANGTRRRQDAEKFVERVQQALAGDSPFTPTPMFEPDELRLWLDEFPDQAVRELSLSDLSILKVFEHQCSLNEGRRVYVWSLDRHLSSCDRPPKV